MSWGGLPWWVYEIEFEHGQALISGCMENEWHPSFARSFPQYLHYLYK